jgi:hypothetical protein
LFSFFFLGSRRETKAEEKCGVGRRREGNMKTGGVDFAFWIERFCSRNRHSLMSLFIFFSPKNKIFQSPFLNNFRLSFPKQTKRE